MLQNILKVVLELVRWTFIVFCTAVYVSFSYLASINFRPNQSASLPSGILDWTTSVGRHVVLVTGALPLIVVVTWAWRVNSWRAFVLGAAIVVGMLAFHYVLFAVSAHSDLAYPWFQAAEFVIFGFAFVGILRSTQIGG